MRSELQEVSQQHLRSQIFRRSLQRHSFESMYLYTVIVRLLLMELIVSPLLVEMSRVGSQQDTQPASSIRPASLIFN